MAGRPEGEAVDHLAPDASRYVTGAEHRIDPGPLIPTTTSGAPA